LQAEAVEDGAGRLGRVYRGELLQKLERLESEVGRAVAPAVSELVEQTPVRQARQPLGGDRRSRRVTAKTLQASVV